MITRILLKTPLNGKCYKTFYNKVQVLKKIFPQVYYLYVKLSGNTIKGLYKLSRSLSQQSRLIENAWKNDRLKRLREASLNLLRKKKNSHTSLFKNFEGKFMEKINNLGNTHQLRSVNIQINGK